MCGIVFALIQSEPPDHLHAHPCDVEGILIIVSFEYLEKKIAQGDVGLICVNYHQMHAKNKIFYLLHLLHIRLWSYSTFSGSKYCVLIGCFYGIFQFLHVTCTCTYRHYKQVSSSDYVHMATFPNHWLLEQCKDGLMCMQYVVRLG